MNLDFLPCDAKIKGESPIIFKCANKACKHVSTRMVTRVSVSKGMTRWGEKQFRTALFFENREMNTLHVMECPKCGGRFLGKPVKGIKNEQVPCNAKCTNATGPNCECSCGGMNHGHSHR